MSPSIILRRTIGVIAVLGVLCVLLGLGRGSAPETVRASPVDTLGAVPATLEHRMPELMRRYEVPGATVALVRDGRVTWVGAYGVADREAGRRMTEDAVFRAESISKPVTAWGVMRLVETGRIELDAPVQRYLTDWTLPGSTYDVREITVRRLLSHSAGLARGTIGEEYAPGAPRPSLRDYLTREVHIVRRPGTAFAYSNVGFNLLHLLVESVTDRDFATYMAEAVLRPLGMTRSHFGPVDSLAAAAPTGYELDGTPVPPYEYPAQASGGLRATAGDLARFVAATVAADDSARVGELSADRIRALHAPRVPVDGLFGVVADAYGLGHFVETLPGGRRAVWHGGQGHGWMAHVHAVPAADAGIVILTNSERSWPLFARVLDLWTRRSGLGSVGMHWITTASTGLLALIALLGGTTLWMGVRLAAGLRAGRRRWAPLSRVAWARRLVQAAVGLGVLGGLAWSAAQPYLFVTSIFPATAGWAGWALGLWATVLVGVALCPRTDR